MRHKISVAALSDIGCKRRNNEDNFGYDQAAGIYVVSDGMGGSAAGEVASRVAVGATMSHYNRMRQQRATWESQREGQPEIGRELQRNVQRAAPFSAQDLLYFAIAQANDAVFVMSRRDPRLTGMGATLVAVCFDGANAAIANLGDSRAYLLRGRNCYQITEDHSLVAEQMRQGVLAADPRDRPGLNVITKAIGTQPSVDPDLFEVEMTAGDRLLLATDGLMKHMTDPEIAEMISTAGSIDAACALLINTVKARGALDNVTCLLLEVQAAP